MDKDGGMSHIASWQSHGRCFMVHQPDKFVKHVLSRWFSQSTFASFRRQLNTYGFHRITAGPDKGGYYHELFLRGKRFLTRRIPRVYIKGVGAQQRRPGNDIDTTTNVNFYMMRPLPMTPSVVLSSAVSPPATTILYRLLPHQGSSVHNNNVMSAATAYNEDPVVVVREGSMWHHPQCNVAAGLSTTQFRTNNYNNSGFPTPFINSLLSSSNATATEILLRQLQEDSLSLSSSSLVQTVMAIASRRQQAQSVAAMAAVAAATANNTVDSRLLRLELILAQMKNCNNSSHY